MWYLEPECCAGVSHTGCLGASTQSIQNTSTKTMMQDSPGNGPDFQEGSPVEVERGREQ